MKRLDNPVRRRIDEAILETLSDDPYESKRISAQEHKGKRILRVGDYRIIFAICEECKRFSFSETVGCSDCRSHGSNHVILFSVSHRSIVYEGF